MTVKAKKETMFEHPLVDTYVPTKRIISVATKAHLNDPIFGKIKVLVKRKQLSPTKAFGRIDIIGLFFQERARMLIAPLGTF